VISPPAPETVTLNRVHVQNGGIGRPFRLQERISEPGQQRLLRRPVCPDRQAAAGVEHDLPQVIDAMHMVRMRMGIDNRIKCADPGIQQLLAHVRRGVDQNACCSIIGAALHQQRAAATAVFRICWVTVAPIVAQSRHAARRTAAQNCEGQSGHQAAFAKAAALTNRRSKLAVVWTANSASVRPKSCAPALAVKAV
jgi:hypothetical protein